MSTQQMQLADALRQVANTMDGGGEHKQKNYGRGKRRTKLSMNAILSGKHNTKALFDAYSRNHKHSNVASNIGEINPPLNEQAFFIDCALEAPIMNATFGIGESILNFLNVRSTIDESVKYGFITSIDSTPSGPVQAEPCDDPQVINDDIGACKLEYPLARNQKRTKTGEIDRLIRRACRGVYTDMYFVGDIRGQNAAQFMRFTASDRNLITEGALMKQMKMVGRYFSQWMSEQLWTGNPAGNTTGTAEFLGMELLTSGDYAVDLAPYLEGTNCEALNADVKDFASECISNGGLWQTMLEADHTIMLREQLYGLMREVVWLVMNPVMFKAFWETIPCEMVGNGCTGATINANSGMAGDMGFNLTMQDQIRNGRRIIINNTEYRIALDNGITATEIAPNEYESTIYAIPQFVSGEEVWFLEHIDYSNYLDVLAPLPAAGLWNESTGWTDGGRFFHTIERQKTCFEVTTKVEPRVIFTAPHLTWRIDNVRACYTQAKPQPTPLP